MIIPNRSKMLIVSFLALIIPVNVAASDKWDEYATFVNRFYFLDAKPVNGISCKVIVPILGESLKMLKSQLEPIEKNSIQLTENFSDFRFKWSKTLGVSFDLPSFDAKILSEEGLGNRNDIESMLNKVKKGIQLQIAGAAAVIKGIFEALISPKRHEVIIKEFMKTQNQVEISYERGGVIGNQLYSDTNLQEKQTGQNFEMQSSTTFTRTDDDKLVPTTMTAKINQAGNHTSTDFVLDYQTIDAITFFRQITATNKIETPLMKQEFKVDILFQDCKVELTEQEAELSRSKKVLIRAN